MIPVIIILTDPRKRRSVHRYMSSKFGDLADEKVLGGAEDVDDADVQEVACCEEDTRDMQEHKHHQPLAPTFVRQRKEPNQLVQQERDQQQQTSHQQSSQIMVEQPETLRSSLLFRSSSSNGISHESPLSTTHRRPRGQLSIRNFRLAALANERIISSSDDSGAD